MVTFEELETADVSELGAHIHAQAFFKGTDALAKFAQKVMLPQLEGIIKISRDKLNDQDKAIIATYYRMYGWMRSLVAMNDAVHFQGIAAAARSLYELLLDLKMLADDAIGEMAAKFRAFPEVGKFRSAKNLVEFLDSHPGSNLDISTQKNFFQARQATIDQTIIKHWGKNIKGNPNRPTHWSGINDTYQIARNLDNKSGSNKYQEWYRDAYSWLSWHIHSTPIGLFANDREFAETAVALSHSLAQQMFLEATAICGKAMKISMAVEWFYQALENLRLTPGTFLVEEQIKCLEEKARQGG